MRVGSGDVLYFRLGQRVRREVPCIPTEPRRGRHRPTKSYSPRLDLPPPKDDFVEVPLCGDLLVVLDIVLLFRDSLGLRAD